VHLKIDTGMGRVGVWHEQAEKLYAEICAAPHIALAGMFTHFSSSDEDPAFTAEQRRRFLAALQRCPGIQLDQLFIHADSSAGLETLEGAKPFNAVRIGLLQFGILPRADSLLAQVHTEPVFSFKTRVGLVKDLPTGNTISYGRTYTLKRDTRIAVLTAGYGDGIQRASSNRAQVIVRGKRCPVLGRVTMDQTIIDVTDVPGVARGDEVVLVGRQDQAEISLTEFSRWADTIPWETLCSVSKRVPRIYKTQLGI
jgi:alanine racemase